jgi:hypothetical protein
MAVMLNTLLQNSGSALAYPSVARINMRASPILCALDAILAVIKFVYLVFLGCAPRTAARHVWWARFAEDSDRAGSGCDTQWFWSMVAFLLGALPQLVKLYAMHGIPFTQALTTLYFAPFVIFETFRLIAGTAAAAGPISPPAIAQGEIRMSKIIQWAGPLGEIGQLLPCLRVLGYISLKTLFILPVDNWVLSVIIALLCLLALISFYLISLQVQRNDTGAFEEDDILLNDYVAVSRYPAVPQDHPVRDSGSLVSPIYWPRACFICVRFFLPVLWVTGAVSLGRLVWGSKWPGPWFPTLSELAPFEVVALIISPLILLLLSFPFTVFRNFEVLSKAIGAHEHSWIVGFYLFCFPLLCFGTLMLYYKVFFESSGTWAPTWTQRLG